MEIRLKIIYFKPLDGCAATAERCIERELITPRITRDMFVPFHHHCLYLWLAMAPEEHPAPERALGQYFRIGQLIGVNCSKILAGSSKPLSATSTNSSYTEALKLCVGTAISVCSRNRWMSVSADAVRRTVLSIYSEQENSGRYSCASTLIRRWLRTRSIENADLTMRICQESLFKSGSSVKQKCGMRRLLTDLSAFNFS